MALPSSEAWEAITSRRDCYDGAMLGMGELLIVGAILCVLAGGALGLIGVVVLLTKKKK